MMAKRRMKEINFGSLGQSWILRPFSLLQVSCSHPGLWNEIIFLNGRVRLGSIAWG